MSGIRRKVKSSLPAFFKATGLKPFANDTAYASGKGSALEDGDAYYNTTLDEIRVYDATAAVWKTVFTAENDGTFNIADVTESTDKDTGALVVEGGVGIEKRLNVGGNTDLVGALVVTGETTLNSDVTINANLQVNGTTTTIDVDQLDITDPRILVNNGGTEAQADNASGVEVFMSDATNAGIGFDKDVASFWVCGRIGDGREIIVADVTQVLSNKSTSDDFSVGGGLSVTNNATVTGSIFAANGAAGTPAISFTSDTDTGIFWKAADNFAFGAGGVEGVDVLKETTLNNVNIGIGNPANTSFQIPVDIARSFAARSRVVNRNLNTTNGAAAEFEANNFDGTTAILAAYSALTTLTALAGRAALRADSATDGISLVAEAATGDIEFHTKANDGTGLRLTLESGGELTFETEIGTPVTPATGTNNFYFKANARPHILDDTGTELQLSTVTGTETFTNKTIDATNNTISNIGDSELTTGIDAAKIADGTVSNTEFQHLDGVTSDIQPQIDGKASTTLNNLGATSINADMDPDGDNTRNQGGAGNNWNTVYARRILTDAADMLVGTESVSGVSNSLNVEARTGAVSGSAAVSSGSMLVTSGNNLSTAGTGTGTATLQSGDATGAGSPANTGDAVIESGAITSGTATGATGDAIIRTGTNAGSGARGEILMVDGSEGTVGHVWTSTDVNGRGNWAAPGLQTINSTSSTTTIAITDDVIFADATTASYTINLPTAVGNSGKVYEFRRTDTDWSNTVTIDPNAAETIGGSATTTLDTDGETLKVVSDGSNWLIIGRETTSTWRSFTPTGTWTTNTTYSGFKRRVGQQMEVQIRITLAGAPNATTLTVNVPDSLSMDSALMLSGNNITKDGGANFRDNSTATAYKGYVWARETTNAITPRFFDDTGLRETSTGVTQTLPFTWASGDVIHLMCNFVIDGWNA